MKHVRTVSKSTVPAMGQVPIETLVVLITFIQDLLNAFLNLVIAKQSSGV